MLQNQQVYNITMSVQTEHVYDSWKSYHSFFKNSKGE